MWVGTSPGLEWEYYSCFCSGAVGFISINTLEPFYKIVNTLLFEFTKQYTPRDNFPAMDSLHQGPSPLWACSAWWEGIMSTGVQRALGLLKTLPRVGLANLRALPGTRNKVSTTIILLHSHLLWRWSATIGPMVCSPLLSLSRKLLQKSYSVQVHCSVSMHQYWAGSETYSTFVYF